MSAFQEYARYYDVYYAEKDYDGERAFIEAAFAQFGCSPRTILDLACGTGNHGLRLAAKGYEICGVDQSEVMLDLFRRKAEAQGASVELHCQDLRELSLDRQFDAAICMFDAVDYLVENSDLSVFFRALRHHVAPEGLLIFDFWHAVPLVRHYDPVRVREFHDGSKRLVRISTTTLDIAAQVANVEFRVMVFEDDRLCADFAERHPMRYFLPQEMRYLVESNGWKLRGMYPAFSLDEPVTEDTWHIVMVAAPT